MASGLRNFTRLARVDLREHEDKILLLLALVISAVVGLIVVAFVAVTERMSRVLLTAGYAQRFFSPEAHPPNSIVEQGRYVLCVAP